MKTENGSLGKDKGVASAEAPKRSKSSRLITDVVFLVFPVSVLALGPKDWSLFAVFASYYCLISGLFGLTVCGGIGTIVIALTPRKSAANFRKLPAILSRKIVENQELISLFGGLLIGCGVTTALHYREVQLIIRYDQ